MKLQHQFLTLITIVLNYFFTSFIEKKDKKEFIGTITYSIKIESKKPKVSSKELNSLYGDEMILDIKNGNYKMSFNGKDLKEIYYLKSLNTEYTLRRKEDTLYSVFFGKEDRILKSSKIIDTIIIIAQRQCKILINELEEVKNIYYYDPTLHLNPTNFKNYKFSYGNIYYENAKAPWLKYEFYGTSFNLVYIAMKIEEKELNDKIFDLPDLPKVSW